MSMKRAPAARKAKPRFEVTPEAIPPAGTDVAAAVELVVAVWDPVVEAVLVEEPVSVVADSVDVEDWLTVTVELERTPPMTSKRLL